MISKKGRHDKQTIICPLCGKVVKSVTDVDPKQKVRFYNDQAECAYAWYTKKREEFTFSRDDKDHSHHNQQNVTEKSPFSVSLDCIEIKEAEDEDPNVKTTLEQCINAIKPRVLEFNNTSFSKQSHKETGLSPETPGDIAPSFDEGGPASIEEFNVHFSYLTRNVCKSLKEMLNGDSSTKEDNNTMEKSVINIPKRFTVRHKTRSIKI